MCDAAAHAQGLVKVVITQRVVSGKKVIFNWAKLYDPMLGVQFVVNEALAKAASRSERSLIFAQLKTFSCQAAYDNGATGTEVEPSDLDDLTVAHLRDGLGCFLQIHAEPDAAGVGTPPAVLPSGLQKIVDTQQMYSRALPAVPDGPRFEHRLFRALVNNMRRDGLFFPLIDAKPDQSGARRARCAMRSSATSARTRG